MPILKQPSSIFSQESSFKDTPQNPSKSPLKTMPRHLLSCYNILRFLNSRDAKIKLMYALNYFRSVQKRFALDLREFGTRDRIDGAVQIPFTQSSEANSTAVNNLMSSAKQVDHRLNAHENQQHILAGEGKKMTVFDEEQIASVKDLASLRFYKVHGIFNSRVFHTCPG